MMVPSSRVSPSSSFSDVRRQSELPTPQELKDFIQDYQDEGPAYTSRGRRPSVLERESETCQCCSLSPKARAYMNILGAGFSFMLMSSSVLALASLQSSLNDDGGLGLATLAIGSASFLISGLFSSSLIKIFGTKYTIILGYITSLLYILTNYYPQWYTLVPGVITYGIGHGPNLAAVNVHVTIIAVKYAPRFNEKTDHMIAYFTGIFTMFFRLSFIPGNLATTIILFSERSSSGNDIVDSSLGPVCNNTEFEMLDPTYVYVLLSSFVAMAIVAIVIAFLCIDNPGTDIKYQSCNKALSLYLKDPILATLKMFIDWKIYMLLLMVILTAFTTSTTLGKLAKVYVSDCIGVHWVGLFALTYGTCSGLSAVITGRLVKFIPQFLMVYSFSAVMVGTVLFLLFWEIEPSYLLVFLPIGIIGVCDGMWHAVPPTLVGIIYPLKKEPAYATVRMGLALGRLMGFLLGLFFTTSVSLWTEVAIILASVSTYSVLVFITQSKEQLLPCLYLSVKDDRTDRGERTDGEERTEAL